MRILYLEPYWGGSHRIVAEALAQELVKRGHYLQFCHLPDRFWKCRMRAASLDFLQQLEELARAARPKDSCNSLSAYLESFDVLFVSTLCDVAQLKGLLPSLCPPILAYFHENQLCYPAAPQKKGVGQQNRRERQDLKRNHNFNFGLINIISALVADITAFNSDFQRQQFLCEIRPFLQALPDKQPLWVVERIAAKARSLYLGVDAHFFELGRKRFEYLLERESRLGQKNIGGTRPVILWNHRWEFDKQPELFFAGLRRFKCLLEKQGGSFSLLVLGENRQVQPTVFVQAQQDFAREICHWGFVESRQEYARLLAAADLVVSCAVQENFGLSVLEAVAAGAWPILPQRLCYPELYGKSIESSGGTALEDKIFYDSAENYSRCQNQGQGQNASDEADLLAAALLRHCQPDYLSIRERQQFWQQFRRFSWSECVQPFEAAFYELQQDSTPTG